MYNSPVSNSASEMHIVGKSEKLKLLFNWSDGVCLVVDKVVFVAKQLCGNILLKYKY